MAGGSGFRYFELCADFCRNTPRGVERISKPDIFGSFSSREMGHFIKKLGMCNIFFIASAEFLSPEITQKIF